MKQKQYDRAQELIRDFVKIQRELFDMGLILTAGHLSKTVDQMGWELAEKSEQDKRFSPEHKKHLALVEKLKAEGRYPL
ncbi:MAG: hypothetical protein KGL39_55945 [Patescibacteria group bacterium]|nr:hypothetical protein [Patescibacteria group bacterium]